MIQEEDRACLRRIHDGTCRARGVLPANHEMIAATAARYDHRPEVIAGILLRESRGGEILDEEGLGDQKHGHGLMQVDDRSFAAFCSSEKWKDPAANIEFGAGVLDMKRTYLFARTKGLAEQELERAAIAAYNCGEGRVLQSIMEGEDVDTHTTGGDYSRAVLAYAGAYAAILEELAPGPVPLPAPTPSPEPAAAAGFWAGVFNLLLKLFVKKSSP